MSQENGPLWQQQYNWSLTQYFVLLTFLQIDGNNNSMVDRSRIISDIIRNNFTPAITRIISFAKMIPGFLALDKDDQITLLKASSLEVLLVRLAHVINVRERKFAAFAHYQAIFNPNEVQTTPLYEIATEVVNFAGKLKPLQLTNCEVALFSAAIILCGGKTGCCVWMIMFQIWTQVCERHCHAVFTNWSQVLLISHWHWFNFS